MTMSPERGLLALGLEIGNRREACKRFIASAGIDGAAALDFGGQKRHASVALTRHAFSAIRADVRCSNVVEPFEL